MKVLSVLFLLILAVVCSSVYSKEELKPYKWDRIIGLRTPGKQIYIDHGNMATRIEDGRKLNVMPMLEVLDVPIEITDKDGNKILASSIITYIMVNCGSGAGAPLRSFLLKEKSPTLESRPLAGKSFADDSKYVFHLDKSEPSYWSVCPEEI